jgi:hypothetical protein
MPSLPFDLGDAVELAELLEFLSGWLESDRAVHTASLPRFVDVPDYGPDSLREDFADSGSCWASPTERAC